MFKSQNSIRVLEDALVAFLEDPEVDVNEVDVNWEQVVEDVPGNRSTDPDTLAVQRSESLLSFSPACYTLF